VSKSVQLFVTCIVDTLYPETGEAVVRVLQRAGCSVDFPEDQTCCGQPAFNAGMRPHARQMAENTIQVFENTTGDIVIPSGSCAGMIKHGYKELFADDPGWFPRAESIAKRTYEFTEYLVDNLGIEHPEISKEMLERKIENLEASGASVLVSCDAGCVAHISGGLQREKKPLKAVHIAEILDHH
jgi:Fe-S oxidoreductase